MGAYFRCYKNGRVVQKTLIMKKGGSPYPNFDDFVGKIKLLNKYLRNFVVGTKIYEKNNRYHLEQNFILGKDLDVYLKQPISKQLKSEIKKLSVCLDIMYKKTGILPDLNKGNIFVTKNNSIKLVDVWPLFFYKRVTQRDLSKKSYCENLEKLEILKILTNY